MSAKIAGDVAGRRSGAAAPEPKTAAARGPGPDPRGAVAPAALRAPARRPAPAVFIHSSWRTGSTWFWLKFRALPATLCYYEPFHEGLAAVTREQARRIGPSSWASGHPAGAPYHLEFLPLIRRAGGVRLFVPQIAYDWFMPAGGIAGRLRPQELRYLGLLLRHAARRDKVAVFGFTRSLGRLAALKRHFGGTHVFLYRNLWTHWASYMAQRRAGNGYFVETMLRVLLHGQDGFFAAAAGRALLRATARGRLSMEGDRALPAALAETLSEAELFGLFMALHLYLYACAQISADLCIDVTRLARERSYRAASAHKLSAATGLSLDLADVADTPQAHWPAPDDIDWQEIRENFAFAVHTVDHRFDGRRLMRIGLQRLAETIAEMRISERYLGRARAEIATLQSERDTLAERLREAERERDQLAAALARLTQDRQAAHAVHARPRSGPPSRPRRG